MGGEENDAEQWHFFACICTRSSRGSGYLLLNLHTNFFVFLFIFFPFCFTLSIPPADTQGEDHSENTSCKAQVCLRICLKLRYLLESWSILTWMLKAAMDHNTAHVPASPKGRLNQEARQLLGFGNSAMMGLLLLSCHFWCQRGFSPSIRKISTYNAAHGAPTPAPNQRV